jgi:hypothetical protein
MNKRNLTDHQRAVEEAAGMSLDLGMANAATVAQGQSHHDDNLNYEECGRTAQNERRDG